MLTFGKILHALKRDLELKGIPERTRVIQNSNI